MSFIEITGQPCAGKSTILNKISLDYVIRHIKNRFPVFKNNSNDILKKFNNITWNKSIIELHKPENIGEYNKNFYKRLAFDEIFSTFIVNSEIRKKIKKIKKINKNINQIKQNELIDILDFSLTYLDFSTLITKW